MVWWLWIALGLALLIFEVATPGGFVAFFFSIAALLVGILVGLGLTPTPWVQGLLFSLLSVGSLLALRRPIRRLMTVRHGGPREMDSLVGESALPESDLEPGTTGQAELRGTRWNARNASERTVRKGERCRVDRVDGLLLFIKPE
jgi:hypothetical protein